MQARSFHWAIRMLCVMFLSSVQLAGTDVTAHQCIHKVMHGQQIWEQSLSAYAFTFGCFAWSLMMPYSLVCGPLFICRLHRSNQCLFGGESLFLFVSLCFSQYFIYCCILGLVSCSVFLRINYELKMVVMLVAVVIYNVIILQTHAPLLDGYSTALYRTQSFDRYTQIGRASCRERV